MGVPSEDDLIATYFAPIAGPGGLGLLDDAALVAPPPGCEIVVTTDALVAGVHFFPNDAPGRIAAKALRDNLSDLAAKGTEPLGFLLALALPREASEQWLAAFAKGLGEEARAFACPLLGGDTVGTTGPLTISITALGSVPAGAMIKRTGVRPGDAIYVSGTIGDAAFGLGLRRSKLGVKVGMAGRATLVGRYMLPQPRLALGLAARGLAHAGMDVSDGLIGDLSKMLRVSSVSAHVDLRRVPLSQPAKEAIKAAPKLFEAAVTGGDDYELLLAVPPQASAAFQDAAGAAGVRVAHIGVATEGDGPPLFIGPNGRPAKFKRGSYKHF